MNGWSCVSHFENFKNGQQNRGEKKDVKTCWKEGEEVAKNEIKYKICC